MQLTVIVLAAESGQKQARWVKQMAVEKGADLFSVAEGVPLNKSVPFFYGVYIKGNHVIVMK